MSIDANIASIRTDYTLAELDINSVSKNPFIQFETWWKEVLESKLTEPNAFALSTIDKNNFPHSRIVLLKSFDENGFIFFTNYESDKASEIEYRATVAMLFFWKELQRQVRIEGSIEKISEQDSKLYFYSRPKASQIGALASSQSREIANRELLEEKYKQLFEQYEQTEVPFPNNWGGYIVKPKSVEFWQGRASRLHDRLKYIKNKDDWQIVRLQP